MSNLVKNKPKGLLRWLLRAPLWLYHAGLGWVLGERFLMLRYIGHKSGLLRETVIEVMRHDKEEDIYYVASAWGTKSDWFQSVRTTPKVKVQVGKWPMDADTQILEFEDAANELFRYANHHRTAFHEISILLAGKVLQGTEEDFQQLAKSVPVIAFHPKGS